MLSCLVCASAHWSEPQWLSIVPYFFLVSHHESAVAQSCFGLHLGTSRKNWVFYLSRRRREQNPPRKKASTPALQWQTRKLTMKFMKWWSCCHLKRFKNRNFGQLGLFHISETIHFNIGHGGPAFALSDCANTTHPLETCTWCFAVCKTQNFLQWTPILLFLLDLLAFFASFHVLSQTF